MDSRLDAYEQDFVVSEEVYRRRSLQLGAFAAEHQLGCEALRVALDALRGERERWFAVLRDYWEVWE